MSQRESARTLLAADRPRFSAIDFEEITSSLGATLEHDSRDNSFTPSRGFDSQVQATFYSSAFGNDVTFQSYRARTYRYWPPCERLVLGGRVDLRSVTGDDPFYRLPCIDLRGISSARYQDDNAGVLESEMRWNPTSRWAGIGNASRLP